MHRLDLAEAVKRGLVAPVKVILVPLSMSQRKLRGHSEIERDVLMVKGLMASHRDEGEKRRQMLARLEAKKEAVHEITQREHREREGVEDVFDREWIRAETYHSGKPKHVRSQVLLAC